MKPDAAVAPTRMKCCDAIFIVIYFHMAIAAACSCRRLHATAIYCGRVMWWSTIRNIACNTQSRLM